MQSSVAGMHKLVVTFSHSSMSAWIYFLICYAVLPEIIFTSAHRVGDNPLSACVTSQLIVGAFELVTTVASVENYTINFSGSDVTDRPVGYIGR